MKCRMCRCRSIGYNGRGFAMFDFLPIKKMKKKKPNSDKPCVTSSRDYLAEMLLRSTKEKKKKCEAGLLKNFCQFQTANNNTNG